MKMVHLLCIALKPNSAVPMDQGLEQAYNKTAKSAGGIISIIWKGYRHFLGNRFEHGNSEFSLHHEFSDSSAQKSISNCSTL